jgi:hypothetical protein
MNLEGLKFTQVAIYVPHQEFVVNRVKRDFKVGADTDELLMDGKMSRKQVERLPLRLDFFFSILDNFELEFISSENLQHWHYEHIKRHGNFPFLSHFGSYCTEDTFKKHYTELSIQYPMLQYTESYEHSSKRITGEPRHYVDAVFDTRSMYGFNIKLTKKASA